MKRTTLTVAAVMAGALAITARQSPMDVAKRYCDLALEGARLTAEGRKQMAALGNAFDTTAPRQAIVVTTMAATDHAMLDDRRASVRVDTKFVGSLDLTNVRLTNEVPGLHGLDGFNVSLTDGRWKIDPPQPAPYVGVAAAIRYVTALRGTTTDASIRRNADRTLAALKRNR